MWGWLSVCVHKCKGEILCLGIDLALSTQASKQPYIKIHPAIGCCRLLLCSFPQSHCIALAVKCRWICFQVFAHVCACAVGLVQAVPTTLPITVTRWAVIIYVTDLLSSFPLSFCRLELQMCGIKSEAKGWISPYCPPLANWQRCAHLGPKKKKKTRESEKERENEEKETVIFRVWEWTKLWVRQVDTEETIPKCLLSHSRFNLVMQSFKWCTESLLWTKGW